MQLHIAGIIISKLIVIISTINIIIMHISIGNFTIIGSIAANMLDYYLHWFNENVSIRNLIKIEVQRSFILMFVLFPISIMLVILMVSDIT